MQCLSCLSSRYTGGLVPDVYHALIKVRVCGLTHYLLYA